MNRDRAYYRLQRNRHINRKLRILKQYGGDEAIEAWTGWEVGRLSKSKIHCSCWMCRYKTYDKISPRDAKHKQHFQHQLEEFYRED